jgi:hypothetical protein
MVSCPPTGAAQVNIVPRRCRCLSGSSKGVDKSAETSTMLAVSSGFVTSCHQPPFSPFCYYQTCDFIKWLPYTKLIMADDGTEWSHSEGETKELKVCIYQGNQASHDTPLTTFQKLTTNFDIVNSFGENAKRDREERKKKREEREREAQEKEEQEAKEKETREKGQGK